jgi:protocatechuate 3,4-dioxygenase, alpha subunit
MEKLRQTPSQTVGPFFAYSLTAEQYGYPFNSIINGSLVGDDTDGERIHITGSIFDGNGNTISDAMIELWQADQQGKYRIVPIQKKNNDFIGFGRLGTGANPDHHFRFITIKPGSVDRQAPHINVILFMRGSLRQLYTRLYFSDEINKNDALLDSIDATRRQTLIAERKEANATIEYHFDIHMQGEKETVFFDV